MLRTPKEILVACVLAMVVGFTFIAIAVIMVAPADAGTRHRGVTIVTPCAEDEYLKLVRYNGSDADDEPDTARYRCTHVDDF